MRLLLMAAALFLAGSCLVGSCQAATLDRVRAAGRLACGVVTDVDDYSEADTHGNLSAFGADFCRAMAAELFGSPEHLAITALPDEPSGLAAVRDGKVDVLFGATPNPIIGEAYGALFGPPIFFDGQGFLVSNASGITQLADLSRRHVCFINASPPERGLYDALEPMLAVREERFPYTERGEMEAALVDGHCDAITGDVSWMANARMAFHARTQDFTVLPQTITTDPFAPATRAGDPQWSALVDWTVWALLQADGHGVTQANAASPQPSADPVVQRLTGQIPWIAKQWDLPDTAFRAAIQAVGNYGEIYDRDIARPLHLPPGLNRPVSKGGLLWALPIEALQ